MIMIPDRTFWNMVATCKTWREYPAWRDRPELKKELARIERIKVERDATARDRLGVIKKVDRRF